MRLVDDDEIVVAPVDAIYRKSRLGGAARAREVRVVEHVVAELISGYGVVDEVASIGEPVVLELLWAEHEDVPVPALVVFDNS